MTAPKTILITGASSSIGRAAALALAARGYMVFAAARRMAALEALRDEARPHTLVPLLLDVNDPASIACTVQAIEEATQGRGLDFLVNNAGYATAGALAEMPDSTLRAQFETNVFGLMTLTRALLPAMLRRSTGRIVNVSSVSGRVPAPILGAYHATKYAVEALSDALRMEVGEVCERRERPRARGPRDRPRHHGTQTFGTLFRAARLLRADRAHEDVANQARRRHPARALWPDEEAACTARPCGAPRPLKSADFTGTACRSARARRSWGCPRARS